MRIYLQKPEFSFLRIRAGYCAILLLGLANWLAPSSGMLWAQSQSADAATPVDTTTSKGSSEGSEGLGNVEVGYRWTAGFRGSHDMYRNLVNLDRGPNLLNANINFSNPQGTNSYLDRFSLTASNWGVDPYNSVRLFAEKYGAYRFTFDYRNVDYFNYAPNFANPLLTEGVFLGQHSFDMTRRSMDMELILKPNSWISPFFGFSRYTGFGPGLTTFTADGNEYMVNTQYDDATNTFRGGLIFTFSKLNLTLEQGFMKFHDDQHIFQTQPGNSGNRQTPLLGQTMTLDQLDQKYHTTGSTPVSRVQVTAFPLSNLTISGRFVYSQPNTNFNYDARSAGNFVSFDVLRFFSGDVVDSTGTADRPHNLGNLSIEYHPFSHLSFVDSLYIDRFHIASNSSLGRALSGTTPISDSPDPGGTYANTESNANRFAVNMNQNQFEGIVSLTKNISFRGGYRYVWSEAQLQDLATGESTMTDLTRNVGLAGFRFRLPKKVDAFMDFESGRSSGVYNRTNLLNYTKFRLRGKYSPIPSLSINASVTLLDNSNPQTDINYNFKNRGYTFSLAFAPANGERISMSVDYSRADLNSDIIYIIPQLFTPGKSVYIEDSHFGGFNFSLAIAKGSRLNVGYGVISTTGSHPLIYHQPRATLEIPLSRRFTWINEWRYYDLLEKLYTYENFSTNLLTSSIRFNF